MHTTEEQLRLVGYKALKLDNLKRIEEEGPQCVPDLDDWGYGIDRTGRLHVVLRIGKDVAIISQINNLTDRWAWIGFGKLATCYQATYVDLLNTATVPMIIKRDPILTEIANYGSDIALALAANSYGPTVVVRGIPAQVAYDLATKVPFHCVLGAGWLTGEEVCTHNAWVQNEHVYFTDDNENPCIYDSAAAHVLLLLNSNEMRAHLRGCLAIHAKQ